VLCRTSPADLHPPKLQAVTSPCECNPSSRPSNPTVAVASRGCTAIPSAFGPQMLCCTALVQCVQASSCRSGFGCSGAASTRCVRALLPFWTSLCCGDPIALHNHVTVEVVDILLVLGPVLEVSGNHLLRRQIGKYAVERRI
jgi:hypothetical protein